MTTQTIDEAKAGAFAERMIDVLNGACLALQLSIGHQVGLLDTLAEHPSATSSELAAAAGLQERYVRECLAALAVGGIVDLDADEGTYSLPAEHIPFVTRAGGADNLAQLMQFVPLLAGIEDQIVECFRNGGGVPYSAYPRFQQLMAESSAETQSLTLIDHTLPLVDGLTERLRAGIDVCDIGCGQGFAINLMAKEFPNSRFVGYDLSEDGIAAARAEASSLGLTNATFEVRDVTSLGATAAFDLITAFDAIHDQAHPAQVLTEISTALRDDGVFLMVDIKASSNVAANAEIPWAPFLYTVSTMHCMTVSLAMDGDGLGTAWGHELATSMLNDAGFGSVELKDVEGDLFNTYYVAQK